MGERGASRTLARGLTVLRALGDRPRGLTVAELATATDLDRAVLYRLLDTLCVHGFATRDEQTRRFRLGVVMVELGAQAGEGMEVRRVALPVMQALMTACGEAVCLAVRDGQDVIVVERVEPKGLFVRVAYDVGYRHPLSRGAHGKALRDPDQPFTTSTDELEIGTSGVAAPVRDRGGTLVAALGIVAPNSRLTDPATLAPHVMEAAARISAGLGTPA